MQSRRRAAHNKLTLGLANLATVTLVCHHEKLLIAAQDDLAEKARLKEAMKSLSPQQAEMLRLRFFKEMSYKNIAEKTGKSKQTIYNQIFDAVKKLRKYMTVLL